MILERWPTITLAITFTGVNLTHRRQDMSKVWRYDHVELVRVIDGDTVELCIDMGNSIHWKGKFRLYGIDTPERQAGLEAARFVQDTLVTQGIDYVETHKPDKYGRWLVTVVCGGKNLSGELVARGLAKQYFGGKK
jgi:endonuclease YncB( thermonuclease family)